MIPANGGKGGNTNPEEKIRSMIEYTGLSPKITTPLKRSDHPQ